MKEVMFQKWGGTCSFVHKLKVNLSWERMNARRFWGEVGRTQKRKMGVEVLVLLRRERERGVCLID